MIVPDKWKEGASNVTEGGGRKVNENKLLSKKQRYALLQMSRLVHSTSMQILLSASSISRRWQPYASRCKTCKATLHQDALYCQGCAYQKGICAMCGKQILDTSNYKQSAK